MRKKERGQQNDDDGFELYSVVAFVLVGDGIATSTVRSQPTREALQ